MDPPAPPSTSPVRILHVDDDAALVRTIAALLKSAGYSELEVCSDSNRVEQAVADFRPDVVLLDLVMPGRRGQDVLRQLARDHPAIGVIVLTAEYDAGAAVECLRSGASEFLQKPVRSRVLCEAIERTVEAKAVSFEAETLRSQFFAAELRTPEIFENIVTSDPKMLRIFAYLEAVARASRPLLILGETGTGKELLANAVHAASGRTGPFVPVNVAGLDDEVFADTLFGHTKGAFTGAERARAGLVERARGGTLFLDEIGDLSDASQVKLLRLIQEREYLPVGSDEPVALEARVVAATHHAPESLRNDLYFRLRAYQVEIPPLRERLGDLPRLIEVFLADAAEDLGRAKPTVPDELMLALSNHAFPGNIRELQAMVFDAVARHAGGVMPVSLFLDASEPICFEDSTASEEGGIRFPDLMPTLRRIEEAAIAEALKRSDDNRTAAGRMLGISRQRILRSLAAAPEDESSSGSDDDRD